MLSSFSLSLSLSPYLSSHLWSHREKHRRPCSSLIYHLLVNSSICTERMDDDQPQQLTMEQLWVREGYGSTGVSSGFPCSSTRDQRKYTFAGGGARAAESHQYDERTHSDGQFFRARFLFVNPFENV